MSQNSGPAGWPRVDRYFTEFLGMRKCGTSDGLSRPLPALSNAGTTDSTGLLTGAHAALPEQCLPCLGMACDCAIKAMPDAVRVRLTEGATGVSGQRRAAPTADRRQLA